MYCLFFLKLCKASPPLWRPLCGRHDISQQSSTVRVLHATEAQMQSFLEAGSDEVRRDILWDLIRILQRCQ